MNEFKIIEEWHKETFEQKVQAALNDGWELHGPVTTVDDGVGYRQPLKRLSTRAPKEAT